MEKNINGITIGFKSLAEYLACLKPGQLITIASRPGMGKTSLALNISTKGCVESNSPLLLFTLEMDAKEVSTRILTSVAKVDIRKIRTKDWNSIDQDNLDHAEQKISKIPLYINDNDKISIAEIFDICKMKKSEGKLGLVVIDYLQLLAKNENPEIPHMERIIELPRKLKSMAKELGCPVIVLSQLDISYDPGTNKKIKATGRPTLSDLRKTGTGESDSDVILLLHREDPYNKQSLVPGSAEVIVAKNRSGEVGIVNLKWNASYMGFEDISNNLEERENDN